MSEVIPSAGLYDWLRLLFRRLVGVRVEGDSMAPLLRSGDRVLVDPKAAFKPGDIVVARHPYRSSVRILKRLISVDPDGRVSLAGDNPQESEDSRNFGSLSSDEVLGKVVALL